MSKKTENDEPYCNDKNNDEENDDNDDNNKDKKSEKLNGNGRYNSTLDTQKFDIVGFIEDFEKKWTGTKKGKTIYRRYRRY